MPRYPGASRKRIKRGSTFMPDFPSMREQRIAQSGCENGIDRRLHEHCAQAPQTGGRKAANRDGKRDDRAPYTGPRLMTLGLECSVQTVSVALWTWREAMFASPVSQRPLGRRSASAACVPSRGKLVACLPRRALRYPRTHARHFLRQAISPLALAHWHRQPMTACGRRQEHLPTSGAGTQGRGEESRDRARDRQRR